MISSGSPITIERDNDKNPVVALREIADTTVSPDDLKEELVHSLQKYVEVDEPEPAAVPLIGAPGATVDADDTEVTLERMTEEELLKGLEGLDAAGRAAGRRGIGGASTRRFRTAAPDRRAVSLRRLARIIGQPCRAIALASAKSP